MLTGFIFKLIKLFTVWILMGIGLMTLIIYFYYPSVDIHSIKPEQIIEKVKPAVKQIKDKLQVEKVLKQAGEKVVDMKNNLLSGNSQITKSKIEDGNKLAEESLDNNNTSFYSSHKDRDRKLFDRQLAIVTELTG
jgi:hypothetical protein